MDRVEATLHIYTCMSLETSHMSDFGIAHISHADIHNILLRLAYYMICKFQDTGL